MTSSEQAGGSADGRVAAHARAFNAAVAGGDWATFVDDRFTEDAVMSFPQLPVPEAVGRAAVLAAYRGHPPTDTLTVGGVRSTGDRDEVSFTWSNGGIGTMTLHWRGARVRRLEVLFHDG